MQLWRWWPAVVPAGLRHPRNQAGFDASTTPESKAFSKTSMGGYPLASSSPHPHAASLRLALTQLFPQAPSYSFCAASHAVPAPFPASGGCKTLFWSRQAKNASRAAQHFCRCSRDGALPGSLAEVEDEPKPNMNARSVGAMSREKVRAGRSDRETRALSEGMK